ncbi:MAG: metallophosphoesterase [Clostridiales bacterium]|nr:metallophosphoesterase [Clostridiales bacterium]
MALYTIGDTHLSLGGSKAMDSFGGAWTDYVEKLRAGFSGLTEEDAVVFCGDLSWGMSMEEALPDFLFLDALFPGKKYLVKGNHDYWWTTANKMYRFWADHGLNHFGLLHNNCQFYGGAALCGTRGWFFEEEADGHNEKVFHREVLRLETSLKAAGEAEKLCFLHYPPLYQGYICQEIVDLLEYYQVKACYYGHLHGGSHRLALEGRRGRVDYHLVAGDYLNFTPRKILDAPIIEKVL